MVDMVMVDLGLLVWFTYFSLFGIWTWFFLYFYCLRYLSYIVIIPFHLLFIIVIVVVLHALVINMKKISFLSNYLSLIFSF